MACSHLFQVVRWNYPPGPLKLSILPNTQLDYCQVTAHGNVYLGQGNLIIYVGPKVHIVATWGTPKKIKFQHFFR